jgi:hypothetical protein
MSKIKSFFGKMFSGKSEVSSKRVLGTIGALSLFAVLVFSLKPDHEVVKAVEYVVISMFAGTVIEKFSNGDKI